ncbi:hypothetical protein QF017_000850 [Pseudomonas laurylsulfatiphila]
MAALSAGAKTPAWRRALGDLQQLLRGDAHGFLQAKKPLNGGKGLWCWYAARRPSMAFN